MNVFRSRCITAINRYDRTIFILYHKSLVPRSSRAVSRPTLPLLAQRPFNRTYSSLLDSGKEQTNVGHAAFLSSAQKTDDWDNARRTGEANELDGVEEGKGKLQPTSTHLFKLILPLVKNRPPTVFLLHPSQPLSHLSRLIVSSLPNQTSSIYFTSAAESADDFKSNSTPTPGTKDKDNDGILDGEVQWADSTDIGDFTKSAARNNYFKVIIEDKGQRKDVIEVSVPTFERRTVYLNSRLQWIQHQLKDLNDLKAACDKEAHRSGRRMAAGGLGIMVVYWLAVFRLTFWDYGWDIMEPVSYLSGLSMLILGYCYFLYQGREVSYSSLMDTSISRRRSQLYQTRGFDIERWTDLVTEERLLKREISKIAQDYGLELSRKEKDEEEDEEREKDLKDIRKAAKDAEKEKKKKDD